MSRRPPGRDRWFPPAEFYSEEICTRCGICCGATDGQPCEHLRTDAVGAYVCEIYENRLGPHRTVGGQSFECVQIRRVIELTGGYADCAYVKKIIKIREALGQPTDDLGRVEQP